MTTTSAPTLASVMDTLKAKGRESIRRTYVRHGIPEERTFGVTVGEMKPIVKEIKGNQALACELFETGNSDAMYLAGLVVDGAKLTPEKLGEWAELAEGIPLIYESTVPWVTLDHPQAREIALAWMQSEKEHMAAAGWCTYSGLVTITPDAKLDLAEISELLDTVVRKIHGERNRVKSTMNNFVIAVGTYVQPLLAKAKAVAEQIGPVSVDVGDTACKVPLAPAAIAKVESAGKVGQKKRTVRC